MDALLLDLDGTLLDDRTAVDTAFAAFASAHGFEQADSDALARWRALAALHWRRYERGEVTFEDQRRLRVREFLAIP